MATNVKLAACDANEPKRNACFYCKKTYTQMSEHFQTVHKSEPEIKKIYKLPKNGAKKNWS